VSTLASVAALSLFDHKSPLHSVPRLPPSEDKDDFSPKLGRSGNTETKRAALPPMTSEFACQNELRIATFKPECDSFYVLY
jgi:hypothetical protein